MQRDSARNKSESIMTQKTRAMFELDQIREQREFDSKFRAK